MVLVPPREPSDGPLLMDRTPVTVGEYLQCVDAGACAWRQPEGLCNDRQHRTHPINCVGQSEARAYCAWAGKRLPSAEEWRRAAGGDGRRYPWGSELPDDRRAHWGQVCARPPCTAPVGRHPAGASPHGVLDLAGNVRELTSDRTTHGGYWASSEEGLRIVESAGVGTVERQGFRCVLDLSWDYPAALGETAGPINEAQLADAFLELGRAWHARGADPGRAAEHFERAISSLEAAGHPRAFVFHHHAAVERARAGAQAPAVEHLASYLRAGGEDPPPFRAGPLPESVREGVWALGLPEWAHAGASGRIQASAGGMTWRARVELAAGDVGGARRAYLRVLELAPARSPFAQEARARLAGFGASVSAGPRYSCARPRDGTLKCWGSFRLPQDGNATLVDRMHPTSIPGLSNVVEVASGGLHICARTSDGSVHCFGENTSGQRGSGREYDRWVAAVPGVSDVIELAAGGRSTCALRSDGRVLCWGGGRSRREPALVTGLDDVVQIAMSRGRPHNPDADPGTLCARRADRRLLCGRVQEGELALVPGLTNVTDVAVGHDHICAVRADGTVHCWGYMWYPSGVGSVSLRPRHAIAELTDVRQLAAGHLFTCALRGDGTVHCWGTNADGQLGDATHGFVIGPVPGLSDVVQITAGVGHSCAVRIDGSVACWGEGVAGQLGRGRDRGPSAANVLGL